eukprot:10720377-Alexandrium_andersonii.AAC.1
MEDGVGLVLHDLARGHRPTLDTEVAEIARLPVHPVHHSLEEVVTVISRLRAYDARGRRPAADSHQGCASGMNSTEHCLGN